MSAESTSRKLGHAVHRGAHAANRSRKQSRPDKEHVRPEAVWLISEKVALTLAQREWFDWLYREHFDFVFRNLRRLGVPVSSIEDALQEVYLVVLRRIDQYHDVGHARAWLFAIALRTASNYRRSDRRRGEVLPFVEPTVRSTAPSPFEFAARTQASRVLHDFLATLSDAKRAVFVMTELEQMTAPEIARALSMNVNTVYARLHAARREFADMVSARARKSDGKVDRGRHHG